MSSNPSPSQVAQPTTGPAQAGPVFGSATRRRDGGVKLGEWIGVAPFLIFAVMFLIVPTLFLISQAFLDREGQFTFQNLIDLGTDRVVSAFSISMRRRSPCR